MSNVDEIRARWADVTVTALVASENQQYMHVEYGEIGRLLMDHEAQVMQDIVTAAPADIRTLLTALDAANSERDAWANIATAHMRAVSAAERAIMALRAKPDA